VRRPRKGREKNDDEYFLDRDAKNFGYFSEQQFHQLNSQVNTYKLFLNQIQQYHYAMHAIFYYPLFYQNQQNQQANQQASILKPPTKKSRGRRAKNTPALTHS
jgi:hypothetical protein